MDINPNQNAKVSGDSLESAVHTKEKTRPLFEDVGDKVDSVRHPAEDGDQRLVDEIESLCMNCQQNVGFDHFDDETSPFTMRCSADCEGCDRA